MPSWPQVAESSTSSPKRIDENPQSVWKVQGEKTCTFSKNDDAMSGDDHSRCVPALKKPGIILFVRGLRYEYLVIEEVFAEN